MLISSDLFRTHTFASPPPVLCFAVADVRHKPHVVVQGSYTSLRTRLGFQEVLEMLYRLASRTQVSGRKEAD
jgi:hypothetical protein